MHHESVGITSRAQWREWLERHHGRTEGIWVVTYKKGRGPYVGYDDLVEEALCFGWIDSLGRRVDDDRTQLLMTPRKPRSKWSRPNKERVARLTAEGRMAPAGLATVELAKQSGTWEALDAVENLEEPADLAAALDAVPEARRQWDGFPRSTRRAILEWISNAKREATRAKRVAETVAEAAVGRRANQWRQPGDRA